MTYIEYLLVFALVAYVIVLGAKCDKIGDALNDIRVRNMVELGGEPCRVEERRKTWQQSQHLEN